jgi:hypothetical protein
MRVLGGKTVFVCDNLMTHGEDIVLNRRHTEGLESMLPEMLNQGVRGFRERMVGIDGYVEGLRSWEIADKEAESMIYRMVAEHGLPAQYLKGIHRNYFGSEPTPEVERGTAWGLHNAVTRELRALSLHRRLHYTRIVDNAINLN